jgi:hypothetical protein
LNGKKKKIILGDRRYQGKRSLATMERSLYHSYCVPRKEEFSDHGKKF